MIFYALLVFTDAFYVFLRLFMLLLCSLMFLVFLIEFVNVDVFLVFTVASCVFLLSVCVNGVVAQASMLHTYQT